MQIKVKINGVDRILEVQPGEKLLDVLRRYGYKSVKKGCGEGTCGSCSVIVDGRLVYSCITFACQVDGCEIETVEGLGDVNHPHPLQLKFVEAGAVQCGYCTPGMIMAAKALLDKEPNPTEEQIKEALDGNLCRCTGYVKIIEAIKAAAEELREQKQGEAQ